MNSPTLFLPLLVVGSLLLSSTASADFIWKDTEGKHLDLRFDSRMVARYVYEAIDESSAERREETYKPFCHLYVPWTKDQFLTKGPGGKFTHHRGIFYGFSRISYTDAEGVKHEKVDTWHCRKAHQVHRSFSAKESGSEEAMFTSEIDWIGDDGKVFAREARTMRFSLSNSDVIVDFESTLTPTVASLVLDGDPQHAGFQFRAHNDVNDKTNKATYYIRPVSGVGEPGVTINWSAKLDNERTRDLPWKAMCFTLNDKRYTACYLDRPDNPKPARYSERDYGRFGSYFATEVKAEVPLTVRYRLVMHSGEMLAEEVAKLSETYLSE